MDVNVHFGAHLSVKIAIQLAYPARIKNLRSSPDPELTRHGFLSLVAGEATVRLAAELSIIRSQKEVCREFHTGREGLLLCEDSLYSSSF